MMSSKPFRVLCVLLFLLFLFPTIVVAVSCSEYMGDASINEVYELGNSYWIEVKMIDPAVSYVGWQLELCSEQGNKDNCETYGIGGLSLQNSYYLVLSNIDKKLVDIQKNGASDILLVDASGNAVDYLSINGYTNQRPNNCSDFPFPTMVDTTSNKKGIFRDPDGIGSWRELEGSGATGEPTRGKSNDGNGDGDSDDDALTCDNLELSTIAPQIAGVISEEYSICIENLDATSVFNFDYECVNPFPCVGTLDVSAERVEENCHYYKVRFDDVGKIKLDASITLNGVEVSCSSNDFIVKPHHFVIENVSPGKLISTCNDFTYTGQTIEGYDGEAPEFTIRAMNALSQTTKNYTGDFVKLQATDIVLVGPLDNADADQLGTDKVNKVLVDTLLETGTLKDNGDGTLTYTASYSDKYMYSRDNALVSPFESRILLQLIGVEDDDEVVAVGLPLDIEVGGTEIRYGRISLENAYGSELLPLNVPMKAEYANQGSFVKNTDDTCTVITSLTVIVDSDSDFDTVPCALEAGQPGISGIGCPAVGNHDKQFSSPPHNGDFKLWFAASGSGKTGSFMVRADVPDYLKFDWKGDGDENPTAKATFGIYKGNPSLIYMRESVW